MIANFDFIDSFIAYNTLTDFQRLKLEINDKLRKKIRGSKLKVYNLYISRESFEEISQKIKDLCISKDYTVSNKIPHTDATGYSAKKLLKTKTTSLFIADSTVLDCIFGTNWDIVSRALSNKSIIEHAFTKVKSGVDGYIKLSFDWGYSKLSIIIDIDTSYGITSFPIIKQNNPFENKDIGTLFLKEGTSYQIVAIFIFMVRAKK